MGVTFKTNAGNCAVNKRILAGRMEEQFRKVARKEAEDMKRVAKVLSSGNLSLKTLAKMGHPYGLRRPPGAAGQPDFIINKQSGTFATSWQTRTQKTPTGWTVTLWNSAPEAFYLLGTNKMRPRLIFDEIMRQTMPETLAEVRKSVRKGVAANGGTPPMGGSAWGGILYAVGVGVTSAASGIESAL